MGNLLLFNHDFKVIKIEMYKNHLYRRKVYYLKTHIKEAEYFSTDCLSEIDYILDRVEERSLIKPETSFTVGTSSPEFILTLHNNIRYVALDDRVIIEFDGFSTESNKKRLRKGEGFFCIYALLEIIVSVAEDLHIHIHISSIKINGINATTNYLKEKDKTGDQLWDFSYNRIDIEYSEYSTNPIDKEFDTLASNISHCMLSQDIYE